MRFADEKFHATVGNIYFNIYAERQKSIRFS